jgi:hypothetical protein
MLVMHVPMAAIKQRRSLRYTQLHISNLYTAATRTWKISVGEIEGFHYY